jgi:hypothetical protein
MTEGGLALVELGRAQDGQHPTRVALGCGAGHPDQAGQAFLRLQDPRQDRRRVLAEADAEQQVRSDARGDQCLRQRQFDHHDRGVGDHGLREWLGRRTRRVVQPGQHGLAELRLDQRIEALERRPEDRLGLEELLPHPPVLRALARELEHDRQTGLPGITGLRVGDRHVN